MGYAAVSESSEQSPGRNCTFAVNARAHAPRVVDERRADRAHPPRRRRRRAGPAPALLFVPRSDAPLPLVLLGHGAHQSKDDPIVQMLAKTIARGVPGRCRADGRARATVSAGPRARATRNTTATSRRRMGDPDGRRARSSRTGRGRGRGARARRRCSRARSVTPGSRWVRCSACRSSPTFPRCAPRCSRSAACSSDDGSGNVAHGGAQRARARRRAPAGRARGADAQHDARRALPDRRRDRGVRGDPRPEAHGRVGRDPRARSRPRRS